jgi:vacuolar-type H+-ATPase subunit D/Vma8
MQELAKTASRVNALDTQTVPMLAFTIKFLIDVRFLM